MMIYTDGNDFRDAGVPKDKRFNSGIFFSLTLSMNSGAFNSQVKFNFC